MTLYNLIDLSNVTTPSHDLTGSIYVNSAGSFVMRGGGENGVPLAKCGERAFNRRVTTGYEM